MNVFSFNQQTFGHLLIFCRELRSEPMGKWVLLAALRVQLVLRFFPVSKERKEIKEIEANGASQVLLDLQAERPNQATFNLNKTNKPNE